MKKIILAKEILGVSLLLAGFAQASAISCPTTDNIAGTAACEYKLSATQDFLNTDPSFDANNTKDVSHTSYYGLGFGAIPEPSNLALLMAGIVGLVAARRLAHST